MNDLVERLRKAARVQFQVYSGASDISQFMEHQAADEIERLEAKLRQVADWLSHPPVASERAAMIAEIQDSVTQRSQTDQTGQKHG